MLRWAMTFFVLFIIAAIFAFGGIMNNELAILCAKITFFVCLCMFVLLCLFTTQEAGLPYSYNGVDDIISGHGQAGYPTIEQGENQLEVVSGIPKNWIKQPNGGYRDEHGHVFDALGNCLSGIDYNPKNINDVEFKYKAADHISAMERSEGFTKPDDNRKTWEYMDRSYNIIPESEYYRITRCVGDFRMPEFTFEEVQKFLHRNGYEVTIIKGLASVQNGYWECPGEFRSTGVTEEMRERIVAIKPDTKVPERVDSQAAKEIDFRIIFLREMKNKLLNLS